MLARVSILIKKIRRVDIFRLCLAVSIILHGGAYGAYYLSTLPEFGGDGKVYDAKNYKSKNVDVDFIDVPPPNLLIDSSNALRVKKEEWIEGTGRDAKDAENTDTNVNRISGEGTDPDGYLSSAFGDRAPVPVIDFDLNRYFPAQARSANITRKTVVIRLQINEDGAIRSVRIVSPPAGYGFDEAALKVIHKIRFRPGYVSGRPVKMFMNLPITFVLED
jgi:periplasmic protein TonB